jgi:hypothetical protein
MLPSDYLTKQTFFTSENISPQYDHKGIWNWHVPFFRLPHVPEMLVHDKEEDLWTYFMKAECYNPSVLEQVAVNQWIGFSKAPGRLRVILGTYQSH